MIAIIGILAALLTPALKRARDQARGLQCISNLRQVGLAFNMYANESDGWFPAWCQTPDNVYWPEVLADPSHQGNYIPNDRIFACPVFTDCVYPTMSQIQQNGFRRSGSDRLQYVHYGYDGYSFGIWGRQVKMGDIPKPDRTVLLADTMRDPNRTSGSTQYGGCGLINRYRLDNGGLISWNTGVLDPRHSNGVNVLWADMHASYVSCPDTSIPSGPYQALDRRYWLDNQTD